MKALLFIAGISISIAGCIGKTQPLSPDNQTIHPEAAGTPNSEQQGNAFTISTEAFYQASINSSTTPGQVISLNLTPTKKAAMTTDLMNDGQVMVDTGKWTTLNNGNLQLNLKRKGTQDSFLLEFKTDGDKLIYTGSEYGTAGLTLWVKPLPK
jgi:hypothetical protein